VKASKLMKDWPVEQILLPLDVHRWEPVDQSVARELLGLPNGVPILLFGAAGGGNDPRKGFDLLLDSLRHLERVVPDLNIVIFGQREPPFLPNLGFPLHYMGHLADDVSLRLLYSACDVFAMPSRQDALGLTVVEALSCGTPVVAFDHSGPPSIVRHKKTGYLAKYLDSEDFATGIAWVLGQTSPELLRNNAREHAEQAFDAGSIAGQHLELYRKVLASADTEKISPGRGFASIWKR
jgi:glycosyltransferase involved in cell wall biosynthesis